MSYSNVANCHCARRLRQRRSPIGRKSRRKAFRGSTPVAAALRTLANALFDYAGGVLVVTPPNKLRVSEMISFNPFQECDLNHELDRILKVHKLLIL